MLPMLVLQIFQETKRPPIAREGQSLGAILFSLRYSESDQCDAQLEHFPWRASYKGAATHVHELEKASDTAADSFHR